MEQDKLTYMAKNKLVLGVGGLMVAIVVLIVATMFLVPEGTHPAYGVAVNFVNAAATGDDDTALPYMSDTLREAVTELCPDGIPSTCIEAYADETWGDFMSAVFRRAIPDGSQAWDIQLIATYEDGQGFSGICIYNRVEQIDDNWQVTRWSGFVSCDLPTAGLQGLASDSALNQMP
jgi:hypothetical protein